MPQQKEQISELVKRLPVEVRAELVQLERSFGVPLTSVRAESAKVLEAVLKRGIRQEIRGVIVKALSEEMVAKTLKAVPRIPQKEAEPQEFMAGLFKKHGSQFFESHKKEYQEFLRNGGLKDSSTVRSQWTAAWMVYRMARFGGTLGINFKYVHEREDISKEKEIQSQVRSNESIYGGKFSVLINDVFHGSQYSDAKSKQGYVSFGDCDEVSLLMAQMIKLIGKGSNLNIETAVYRLDAPHANSAVKIGGKWFLLEPSLGESIYPELLEKHIGSNISRLRESGAERTNPDMLRAVAALAEAKKGRLSPLYGDEYEEKTAPKIKAILESAPLMKITPAQQECIERASLKAIDINSRVYASLEREIARRKWGHAPRAAIHKMKIVVSSLVKESGGKEKAIATLADFVAASLKGEYEKNRNALEKQLSGRSEEQRLKALLQLAQVVDQKRSTP